MYTDEISDNLTVDSLSELLALSDQYNVRRLSNLCMIKLLDQITIENVAHLAIMGNLFDLKPLKVKSIDFITQNPQEVMKTNDWNDLIKRAPTLCSDIILKLTKP